MLFRETTAADRETIESIHLEAFGPEEGPIVAKLALDILDDDTAQPAYSYVAELDGEVVGHILFSCAHIGNLNVQNLAPLGVLPTLHKQGIGTKLTNYAIEQLKAKGVDLLFVLGYPEYYPRFGFTPAGVQGLDAPYPIPEKNSDAWMVMELKEGILGSVTGTMQCCNALDDPAMWRE